jgi:hypothetical protein
LFSSGILGLGSAVARIVFGIPKVARTSDLAASDALAAVFYWLIWCYDLNEDRGGLRWEEALLENLGEILRQCYERAEECARQAQAVQNKKLRTDYLRLEERWLKLARSYELGQRVKLFINEPRGGKMIKKRSSGSPYTPRLSTGTLNWLCSTAASYTSSTSPAAASAADGLTLQPRRASPSAQHIGGSGPTLGLPLLRAPTTTGRQNLAFWSWPT